MMQLSRQKMKVAQIRFIVLVTSLILSSVSLAQTAAQGIQSGKGKLMRGDYKGAEADLSKALKTSKTRKDQSDAFKFLGISQFMQNKKPLAERSFKQALLANPNASISVNEVADESVVPYFNQIKALSSRQKPAANPTALAKASSAPSKPGVSASRKALLDRQAKRAVVTIISNAPNADILKDGISIGPPGNPMDFDPGTLVLEVHAPGFISKAIKLQLKAGTTSTAKVDLQKKQPKAVPKSIPLPNATASGQGRSPGSMGVSAGGQETSSKGKSIRDRFVW